MVSSFVAELQRSGSSVKELRLSDKPRAYFDNVKDFAMVLKQNRNVEYIRFDHDFWMGLSFTDQTELLQYAGQLSKLTQFHLLGGSIHVGALSHVVMLQQLQVLDLRHLVLRGDKDDFCALQYVLRKHPTLREFILLDFFIEDETVCLDELFKSLATIPNLTVVKIAANKQSKTSNTMVSGSSIAPLCQSATLRELHLSRLPLGSIHCRTLAYALGKNTLRVLSVQHGGLDDDMARKLASGLLASTSLEVLDLSFNDELTAAGCKTLAESLHKNQGLKVLRFWGCKNIGAAGLMALSEMLDQNENLERLVTPMVVGDTECKGKIERNLSKNRNEKSEKAGTAIAAA